MLYARSLGYGVLAAYGQRSKRHARKLYVKERRTLDGIKF